MKNKIVKALVLASIVSMTATGAAGLTFADDDVTTGDTASTSTEATTTTKTVDQLAEALTEAQEDAATKEAAFTKANEDYEAAKAAADEANGYGDALNKQNNEYDWANTALVGAENKTYGLLGEVKGAATLVENTEASVAEKNAAKEAVSKVNSADAAWVNYNKARTAYKKALDDYRADSEIQGNDHSLAENKKAAADAKTAYEAALKDFNTAMAKVTEDAYITTYDNTSQQGGNFNIKRLKDAIEAEEKCRKSVNDTLDEIKKIKDERSEIDEEEAAYRDATRGMARKALVKATKDYNEALANVKTAKDNYTTATKDLVPVFRVFHPGTMEHLYTTGAHERDVLVEKGWKDEKVAWLTVGKDAEDAAPVYRLCYPGTGDHHYTTDKNERDTLIKTQGWIDETVAFYVPKKGDASVYRVYLSSLKIGAHHFTTGRNEYDTLVQNGWRPEGVSFEVSAKDWIDVSGIKTEDERIAKVAKELKIEKDLGIEG